MAGGAAPDAPTTVRGSEQACIRSWEALDGDALADWYADDAVMLAAWRPPTAGRDAIHDALTTLFAMEGLSVKCTLQEAAEDGDLGYTRVEYHTQIVGRDGRPRAHDGTYVAVWRRGSDGWRIVAHTSTPHGPPPRT